MNAVLHMIVDVIIEHGLMHPYLLRDVVHAMCRHLMSPRLTDDMEKSVLVTFFWDVCVYGLDHCRLEFSKCLPVVVACLVHVIDDGGTTVKNGDG